nr:copper chaperone PCu(A)C [uncultured Rhodopila sp.]
MRKILIATTLFAALAFGAAAQTPPSISLENAWARATTASAQAAAIYLTITDHGPADRLVGVATPVAGKAQLHETIHEGTVTKMRPAAGIAVPPGATLSLAPGGYHIMLTELKQPLTDGQSFPLSLTFEKAGTVETTVTVKAAGAAPAHNMDHMNMPGMKSN